MYYRVRVQSGRAHKLLLCGNLVFHRGVTFQAIELSHYEQMTVVKLDEGHRGSLTALVSCGIW